MISEYALDPNILNNWKDFRFFISHFGFDKGRVISQYPKKWKRMVYDACANCKPIERKKIEDQLKNIKDKLIISARQYDGTSSRTWIENAKEEHKNNPFYKIISDSNTSKHPDILVSEEIDEETEGWKVSTGRIIRRTSELIVKCAEPLLRYSKQIVIIDPHIGVFKDRYLDTLKNIFVFLADCENKKEMIQIHCAYNPKQQSWESLCQDKLKPIVPENISVTIKRWVGKSKNTDRLHARYILTERGGIQFDYGLDKDESENVTTDVNLVEENVRKRRWDEFVENPIFEPVGDPITLP